jgi:hypothetical protein
MKKQVCDILSGNPDQWKALRDAVNPDQWKALRDAVNGPHNLHWMDNGMVEAVDDLNELVVWRKPSVSVQQAVRSSFQY